MTESEANIVHRLEALSRELNFVRPIQESDFESLEPMQIDSLEFVSLILESQQEYGIEIPDADVQRLGLKVLRNFVQYVMTTPGSNATRA